MAPPPAAIAIFSLAFIVLLTGIVLVSLANSTARSAAQKHQTMLTATRSHYVLNQVASTSACLVGQDGCDLSCNPFNIATSVQTFAYFSFYNITNGEAVNADSTTTPSVEEVGPFTCVNAPPYAEARITRVSTTSGDDTNAETMTYTEALECAVVLGPNGKGEEGGLPVNLYDSTTGTVTERPASEWVSILKGSILSGGDTVGRGGAPAFGTFAAHGNTSTPNNYMRRLSDDVPVLPLWPHAYLPNDDFKLIAAIKEDSILQWHISSIGETVSFGWEYPLYVKDYAFDRWLYARFVGYLPNKLDLSSRASSLFDSAYSYHKCERPGVTSTVQLDANNYPACALGVGEPLSPDAFFIDINLYLGIPAPIFDANAASGFQAYEFPAFSDVAPNCSAQLGDVNVSPWLWSWGFYVGLMPYVSHTSANPGYPVDFKRQTDNPHAPTFGTIESSRMTSGYNPYAFYGGLSAGKWLTEFGVTRNGATVPAFAFSMMPKMIPLLSPTGLGSTFPSFVMGQDQEVGRTTLPVGQQGERSTLMYMSGNGVFYAIYYYAHGWYTLYTYAGIYSIVASICPMALYGMYRMRKDTAAA